MKVMVISCLEPQHLEKCLSGLRVWVGLNNIHVINNGNTKEKIEQIDSIANEFAVKSMRPKYVEGKDNTKPFIHKITNDFALMFPNEVILKMDEDVILVSQKGVPTFDRGTFYMPTAAVDNYTIRSFVKEFWPALSTKCDVHDWPWHNKDPYDIKEELFFNVYNKHPKDFINFTLRNDILENVTQHNHKDKILMSERGLSTYAVFFHAQDHIDNFGDESMNQEMRFFDLVKSGKFKYTIDHGMFCHHISYHSIRELVSAHDGLVETFIKELFNHYGHRIVAKIDKTSRSHRKNKVCVGSGWYSDEKGGQRGSHQLASGLFLPEYFSDIFVPRIINALHPEAIHIYESNCEIPMDPVPAGIELVRGKRNAKRDVDPDRVKPYEYGAAHDWGSAFIQGAMFAFNNNMDYFFVEQDCLVHNFKKVLSIAHEMDAPIIYGYGDKASYKSGWAEPSLTFVSYSFLPEFIKRMMYGKWHMWNKNFDKVKNPEIQFHRTFDDVSEAWPFGCGMLRPVPWKKEVYFAQRFDAPNFVKFLTESPVNNVDQGKYIK